MKSFKLFTFSLVIMVALSSCWQTRPYVADTEKGTPTSADSALPPNKHEVFHPEEMEAHKEAVSSPYKR